MVRDIKFLDTTRRLPGLRTGRLAFRKIASNVNISLVKTAPMIFFLNVAWKGFSAKAAGCCPEGGYSGPLICQKVSRNSYQVQGGIGHLSHFNNGEGWIWRQFHQSGVFHTSKDEKATLMLVKHYRSPVSTLPQSFLTTGSIGRGRSIKTFIPGLVAMAMWIRSLRFGPRSSLAEIKHLKEFQM
jgi:hypothetical protein